MRILLVEDEIKLANSVKDVLEGEHYTIDVAHDGESGYKRSTEEEYDLIILDIGLPVMDGYEVCKKLREDKITSPIMMLTARDTTKDTIKGLDSGADDYLIKPFSIEEMLARIRALLRRPGVNPETVLTMDSLSMNPKTKIVLRNDKEIKLSSREYALLEYFLRYPDHVIEKSQILERVWGDEVDSMSNVVDVYIGYLRKKIDKDFPNEVKLLHTVKGLGYRLGKNKS